MISVLNDLYVIDDQIPTEKWRIKIPRNVMKRFLGTDKEFCCELSQDFQLFLDCIRTGRSYLTSRFAPKLTLEELTAIRNIEIGKKEIPIHVELPATRRAD